MKNFFCHGLASFYLIAIPCINGSTVSTLEVECIKLFVQARPGRRSPLAKMHNAEILPHLLCIGWTRPKSDCPFVYRSFWSRCSSDCARCVYGCINNWAKSNYNSEPHFSHRDNNTASKTANYLFQSNRISVERETMEVFLCKIKFKPI